MLCIIEQATSQHLTPKSLRHAGNNVSLEDFLAQDAASVRAMVAQNVLPVVHGGANTTALLVIDIEEPARPDGFCALNRSTLVRVVDALRLRVAALKHAMPRCSVSFYGTSSPSDFPPGFRAGHSRRPRTEYGRAGAPTRLHIAKALGGYRRASALGLFDDVEYSTPSLYLTPGQDPENVTREVLDCAERGVLRSNGTAVPLAPFLSWVYEGPKGGADYHCALSAEAMRQQLAVLEQAGAVRVPVIAWFNGMDNKTDMCGGFRDQLAWMQRNGFVPSHCRSKFSI